jgi:murein DD-endopeptidase MepM/ murein hydrolase activator NlpD
VGNGLASNGNLVLIRHSNGYVIVYAHAKELLVKRGDQIKRGQVIAQSGQTGNVHVRNCISRSAANDLSMCQQSQP